MEILEEIAEHGISYVHMKGYEWFDKNLIPSIKHAEKSLSDKNELLADCWYVIGDIYDFNNAPLKAIESYAKSVQFDPKMASAYREIANMQERIGEYSIALENIQKAIQLEPDDENAKNDLIDIEESFKKNAEPLFIKGDIVWITNELLAEQKFEKVVNKLEKTEKLEEYKILARAYGALNELDKYLIIWQKIADAKSDEFEIEYADWFYMPSTIYESEQVWRILKRINNRIKSSIFVYHESLDENYSDSLDAEQQRSLICDFHIFDITKDQVKLEKLRDKYPKWEDIKPNKC
jgi:tetratricopeptide (TPR) repeat protein